MGVWKFKDFVSPAGVNQVQKWYDRLSPTVQADVDELLETLKKKEKWDDSEFRARLKGKAGKGLSEIKWKSERTQYRLIGMFCPGHEYIFLIGCTHKASIYDPPNAIETAAERKKDLANGEGSLDDH